MTAGKLGLFHNVELVSTQDQQLESLLTDCCTSFDCKQEHIIA